MDPWVNDLSLMSKELSLLSRSVPHENTTLPSVGKYATVLDGPWLV